MHDELVDKKRWISNNRFLHALNYCMLLPGPEAQQLAIYIGWLLNGRWGGVVAGAFFVLPAFFLILGLSWTYAVHGDVEWVGAIFFGLRAAVVALVVVAVVRVGSKTLKSPAAGAVAAVAFVALFFVHVPFPVIVLGAAIVGLIATRVRPGTFERSEGHAVPDQGPAILADDDESKAGRPWHRTLRLLLVGLAVWWGPLLLVMLLRGTDDTLSKEAVFFSQAALVTFGGAYSVLAYINDAAVNHFGWLEPGQMVTGLGLAESTPGPLIMVTEFVGFLGAYRFPGGLDPIVAGILGATVTVWATFAPCFLWIFLGAPYIERLRGNRSLNGALAAVTAAVVGVILNLALTFAIAALFSDFRDATLLGFTFVWPEWASVEVFAVALAAVALAGLLRFRWNVVWTTAGCGLAGLLYRGLG